MEADETPSEPEVETSSEPEERKANYFALFVIGIIFLGAGTALAIANPGFYGMTAMGIIFMVIGLANRDKWERSS